MGSEMCIRDRHGTAHLARLITESPRWLVSSGALVVEMAPDQTESMVELAKAKFGEVEVIVDLAGRQRGLVARV